MAVCIYSMSIVVLSDMPLMRLRLMFSFGNYRNVFGVMRKACHLSSILNYLRLHFGTLSDCRQVSNNFHFDAIKKRLHKSMFTLCVGQLQLP